VIEFYPQIRAAHLITVLLSGTLFAARGLGVLAGARWPRHAVVRYSSYTIDTALLTAALMLVSILPSAMFANHWLTLKIALVVIYILLGVLAMGRAPTRTARLVCYVAALLVFALIVGIARRHSPLGWLT
jgi:uncharacterized membrane protein SirB2